MTARKLLRHGLSLATVPFFIVLYFNIENLATRMGLENVLADAVAPTAGRSPVVEFFQLPLVLWIALLGLGFVGGLWVDLLLAKRERAPLLTERHALASRARQAASKAFVLAGELETAKNIAWNESTNTVWNGPNSGSH